MNYCIDKKLLEKRQRNYKIGGYNLEPEYAIYYKCQNCSNINNSPFEKIPEYIYQNINELKNTIQFLFNNNLEEFSCSFCNELIKKGQQLYGHFFFFLVSLDKDLIVELSKINGEEHWIYLLIEDSGLQKELTLEEATNNFFYRTNLLFRKGLNELKNNKTKLAYKVFKKILIADAKCKQAWLELAKCYFLLGNTKESLKITEKLLKEQPDYVGALLLKGWINYCNDNFKETRNICERVLSIYPDIADAYYYLGLIKLNEGEKDKAISYLKKVMEIDPNHSDATKLYYLINTAEKT